MIVSESENALHSLQNSEESNVSESENALHSLQNGEKSNVSMKESTNSRMI